MRMATMEARHHLARWFRRTAVMVGQVEMSVVVSAVAAMVVAEEAVAARIICIATPPVLRVVEVMAATAEMARPELRLLKTEVAGLKQPEERARVEVKELVKVLVAVEAEVMVVKAETVVTILPLVAEVVEAEAAMAHLETVETEALR